MHDSFEQTSVPIVDKINLRPFMQGSCNSRTEAMIWQHSLGNIRDQDRIADIRVTSLDLLNRQVIWQVPLGFPAVPVH